MPSLGRAVVAIGVFDGVHVGHQALLRGTVSEARRLSARAVALTFDRDPDQVVTPLAAAPQLLSLDDKCRFIAECGIDTVLVVPFTPEIAATPAERFLDEVIGAAARVQAIHVGRDFRFGADASGDLDTLYVWGVEHGAEVRPHDLVSVNGSTVTSTRIRRLVASGDVVDAAALLGRPTRVGGVVHKGMERGRELGFPTANIVPDPFSALPADGVYAGSAELPDGRSFAAAISVGTPPSFADARDYLEAHLVSFDGDLYDTHLTLSFAVRLRGLTSFDSLEALSTAIAQDVAAAEARHEDSMTALSAGDEPVMPHYEPEFLDDGRLVIENPDELEAAERAVSRARRNHFDSGREWVPVTEPRHLSGLFGEAGFTAAMVAAPLDAEDIPYLWDPYSPEDMPSYRYGYGVIDRTFTLMVPSDRVEEARRVLGIRDAAPGSPEPADSMDSDGSWATPDEYKGHAPQTVGEDESGLKRVGWIVLVLLGFFVVFRLFGS